jgi:hypothetical protein
VGEGDPSSPDCNPLDYFAWGVFELRLKAKSRKKTKDLIPKIRGVMVSLAKNTVAKASKRFRSQIETVIAAGGIFIE